MRNTESAKEGTQGRQHPQDKDHIFTEGGRGEASQKVNPDSTGYRLFILKGIVEAHDGSVWFESDGAGKGTTFFVEVPAK